MTAAGILAVAIGGAFGALLRGGLAEVARYRPAGDLPWATVLVNIVGSFLLGLLTGIVDSNAALLLGVGGAGGLTTFSTASAESLRLGRFHERRLALLYTGLTLVGALSAAWLGLVVGGSQ
jgi:CrcB protein